MYINFLYVLIFIIDCVFIAMCHARWKEMKASKARAKATESEPTPTPSLAVPEDWTDTHTVQDSSILHCTPDTAFRFVGTPGNWPLWYPVTRYVVGMDGYDPLTPATVGCRVQEHVRFQLFRVVLLNFTFEWEFLKTDEPQRIVYRGRSLRWGGHSQIDYTFAPTDDGNGTKFRREMTYAQTNPLIRFMNWWYFGERFKEASSGGVHTLTGMMAAMERAEQHVPGT